MAKVLPLIQPLSLYRYRSLNTDEQLARELSAIENNYLWCSNFECLNDPMEGAYEASLLLEKDPGYESIKKYIFEKKLALGICSFSETNDNDLMWAHYADQFKGICIAYSFEDLLTTLGPNIDFVRLTYSEKIHRIYRKHTSDDDVAKRILSTKSHRWLYEREWRLFSSKTGPLPLRARKCISYVYIGNRMTKDRKKTLMRLLDAKKIRYKIMAIDGYSIRFEATKLLRLKVK